MDQLNVNYYPILVIAEKILLNKTKKKQKKEKLLSSDEEKKKLVQNSFEAVLFDLRFISEEVKFSQETASKI